MKKLERKLLMNNTSEERYHQGEVKAKLSVKFHWLIDLNDKQLTQLLEDVTGYRNAYEATVVRRTVHGIFTHSRYYLVLSMRL
jgi:hypothetical protein